MLAHLPTVSTYSTLFKFERRRLVNKSLIYDILTTTDEYPEYRRNFYKRQHTLKVKTNNNIQCNNLCMNYCVYSSHHKIRKNCFHF